MASAPEADDKQAQAYLPDFCAPGAVLVILLVAELVAILLTLVSFEPGAFLTELSKMSMFVLVACAARHRSFFARFVRGPNARATPAHS